MVFKYLCIRVLWTKVVYALEGLMSEHITTYLVLKESPNYEYSILFNIFWANFELIAVVEITNYVSFKDVLMYTKNITYLVQV